MLDAFRGFLQCFQKGNVGLVVRAPEVVTRSEIIEHVWDAQFDSESNLVEVYVNRLRHKLTAERASNLIQTVHGAGYRVKSTA
jgi:DNA-binding response OmpR family regulator